MSACDGLYIGAPSGRQGRAGAWARARGAATLRPEAAPTAAACARPRPLRRPMCWPAGGSPPKILLRQEKVASPCGLCTFPPSPPGFCLCFAHFVLLLLFTCARPLCCLSSAVHLFLPPYLVWRSQINLRCAVLLLDEGSVPVLAAEARCGVAPLVLDELRSCRWCRGCHMLLCCSRGSWQCSVLSWRVGR